MSHIFALCWIGIIAFGIILYVILDGFDLGIGILFPFFSHRADRDTMVATILPVWDGNETWLVFGGASLYGAFPEAFSLILPIIYAPIFVMLLGLLFRGVAFEFRLKVSADKKNFWDACFFLGSLIASLAQGYILGIFVQGFTFVHQQWLPLPNGSLTFSIFCAIALVAGYALLGANRLIAKTEGELQRRCYSIASYLQYLIFIAVVVVSVWTPALSSAIAARWFAWPNMVYLSILPLLTVILCGLHYYALRQRWEHIPFWCAIGIFLACYAGFIISNYPYIIPREVTYLQAAASEKTLRFMLIGAAIMLPTLLYYTYYAYRIFGGKVKQSISSFYT